MIIQMHILYHNHVITAITNILVIWNNEIHVKLIFCMDNVDHEFLLAAGKPIAI